MKWSFSWVVILTLLFLQWRRVWWFPQLVWLYWARGVWNYPQTWCRFDVVALPPPSLFPLAPSCQIGFVEVVWIRRMWVSVSGAIDLLLSRGGCAQSVPLLYMSIGLKGCTRS